MGLFKIVTLIGTVILLGVSHAHAQANSWTNSSNGKWETGLNWSLGVAPSNSQSATFITNAPPGAGRTVTIDGTTTGFQVMTISNLTLSAATSSNKLAVANAASTPLIIRNGLTLNAGGALSINSSTVRLDGVAGGDLGIDGNVSLIGGGKLIVTNSGARVGVTGTGTLTIGDGTCAMRGPLVVGAGGTGNVELVSGSLVVTNNPTNVGTLDQWFLVEGSVTVNRGLLNVTNRNSFIGYKSSGSLTINGGAMLAGYVGVPQLTGSRGTFTMAGGTNRFSELEIGPFANSTGVVWVTGGSLVVTNNSGDIWVGDGGNGRMTVSNGSVVALHEMGVGFIAGSQGTLTINGGTMSIAGPLTVGQNGTGTIWITGGHLVVKPNPASGFAFYGFEIDSSVTLNNGMIVLSNQTVALGVKAAGTFLVNGGRVQGQSVVVAAGFNQQGTFTMAAGTNEFSGSMVLGSEENARGTVWLTGGQLVLTNSGISLGSQGIGIMIVSNGTLLTRDIIVGASGGVGVGVGTLTIAGGTNLLSSSLVLGNLSGLSGTVWITGGRLLVTNAVNTGQINVGVAGAGNFTMSNGTVIVNQLIASNGASSKIALNGGTFSTASSAVRLGNSGSLLVGKGPVPATLRLTGATNVFDAQMFVGLGVNSTGTIWMTAAQLVTTNLLVLGDFGSGQLTMSNGLWRAGTVGVGAGGRGTLTMAGGTNTVANQFFVAEDAGTGTVWITGGRFVATNGVTRLASSGLGQFTVLNATILLSDVSVGDVGSARGTLTMSGSTTTISSNIVFGNFGCTATGIGNLLSGSLAVTNSTFTSTLEVRSGTFTQSGGTLIVNNLVVTNSCGRFVKTGGTLTINGTVAISDDFDADGDGMPNKFELDNGLLVFNPTDAGQDKDGDGQSNLDEFLAGTSPTNSVSAFRITAVARESNNLRVTWTMGSGKTNALERTTGTAGNFSTNGFTAIFTVTNTVGTTTNFIDVGAATSNPARYYRVRLVP